MPSCFAEYRLPRWLTRLQRCRRMREVRNLFVALRLEPARFHQAGTLRLNFTPLLVTPLLERELVQQRDTLPAALRGSPACQATGCHCARPAALSGYRARVPLTPEQEALLTPYAQPDDPHFPVVCRDERPCFLLGDVVEGLAPQPAQSGKKGQPAKEPSASSKHGSCCVLAAVEPLTGQRLYQVSPPHTEREYTQVRQQLAAGYPGAGKIRLVQENLNTHALSTGYDCLPAALAAKRAARCEVCYTPPCGCWLKQIEVDFSALSRQGLNRRLPTQAQLAYQVYCGSQQRQRQAVKIRWQFAVVDARQTLNSQYCKGNKATKQ